MKNFITFGFLISVLSGTSSVFVGCSSHKTTTTTTTEVRDSPRSYDGDASSVSSGPVTSKETTTTETEKSDRGHGLFSILGDIVALPFRAVGALFEAIF